MNVAQLIGTHAGYCLRFRVSRLSD